MHIAYLMRLSRRIRTVLYEDQRFTDFEVDLLHTPALQRLYDLHQLGYADRVFIDASHSRLQHVIGVVEQADKITSSIIRNLGKSDKKFSFGDGNLTELNGPELARMTKKRRWAVRLMALLHDLTHAPYGHTLEDEIKLVSEKHDDPARQAKAFYRLSIQYLAWIFRNESTETWGGCTDKEPEPTEYAEQLEWYLDAPDLRSPPETSEFIDFLVTKWSNLLTRTPDATKSLRRLAPRVLACCLQDLLFAMKALLHLEIAHVALSDLKEKHFPVQKYPFVELIEKILAEAGKSPRPEDDFTSWRDAYLLDIIGNTICADLLDYARRDSVLSGLKLAYDPERIISTMTVVSSEAVKDPIMGSGGLLRYPFNGKSLRTAVSIFSHKLRLDVPGELLNLLQVRFYVYQRMLFHPTKCVAGAMLGAAIQNIGWERLPVHWQHVGDATFLREVRDAGRFIRDALSAQANQDQVFTTVHADAIRMKIKNYPVTGATLAVRAWIDGKTEIASDKLLEHLTAMASIEGFSPDASALVNKVNEMRPKLPSSIRSDRYEALKTALAKECKSSGEILEILFPSVRRLKVEVEAGLRLLDRLGARRFFKVIFRVLPNARGLAGGLEPETIAEKFLNPMIRKYAEWRIATETKLPVGSVAIHCPPAKGPTKIANIIMTDGKSEQMPKLRKLSQLDNDMFKEHEQSVTVQEDLYKSTWRLSVSVSPPYDAQWNEINAVIGAVLHRVLGGAARITNDPHMTRELEVQVAGVTESAGVESNSEYTDDELADLGREFLGLVRKSPSLAQEPREAIEKINEMLKRQEPGKEEYPVGGVCWTTHPELMTFLNRVTKTELFKRKDTLELRKRIFGLSGSRQERVKKLLEEMQSPGSVQQNRVVTPSEEAGVVARVAEILKQVLEKDA